MSKIGIRELKAKTAEILREVSQKNKEFIITHYGKPFGKLVPLEGELQPKQKGKTLRGSYHSLPDLSENDFEQVKGIWKPKT